MNLFMMRPETKEKPFVSTTDFENLEEWLNGKSNLDCLFSKEREGEFCDFIYLAPNIFVCNEVVCHIFEDILKGFVRFKEIKLIVAVATLIILFTKLNVERFGMI